MRNILLGFVAAALSTAGHAAVPVPIDFGAVPGNLGSTHAYSNGGLSVTATGYSAPHQTADLFGKQGSGDERGLGLAGDPSKQNEIYYGGSIDYDAHDFVQVDVKALFGLVSGATFFTGSTTNNEQWLVYGSNTAGEFGDVSLLTGSDENSHALPSFGTYRYYDFVSGGTVSDETRSNGNFLLAGLSLTSAVPEPSTWAMMLVGFGGIGFSMRRRPSKTTNQLA